MQVIFVPVLKMITPLIDINAVGSVMAIYLSGFDPASTVKTWHFPNRDARLLIPA